MFKSIHIFIYWLYVYPMNETMMVSITMLKHYYQGGNKKKKKYVSILGIMVSWFQRDSIYDHHGSEHGRRQAGRVLDK